MSTSADEKTPILLPKLCGRVFVIEAQEIKTRHKFYLTDLPGMEIKDCTTQTDPYEGMVTKYLSDMSARLAMVSLLSLTPVSLRAKFSFTLVDLPDADLPTVYDDTAWREAKTGDYVLTPNTPGYMLSSIQERGCRHRTDSSQSALIKSAVLVAHCVDRAHAIHQYQAFADRSRLLHEYSVDGRFKHSFRLAAHGLAVSAAAEHVAGEFSGTSGAVQ